MERIIKVFIATVGFMSLVCVLSILGVCFGALSGWLVGLIFPFTFVQLKFHFGLALFEPWQIGALLGWIGGFLKTQTTLYKEK